MTEANEKRIDIVVYYGRFQPPHRGHDQVYDHLMSAFGTDSVYIGMTNAFDKDRSPLSFADRKNIWITNFHVHPDKILNLKKMYSSIEVKDTLKLDKYRFICAISKKDSDRLSNGKYYISYENDINSTKLSDEAGYYYLVPEYGDGISGTKIRDLVRTKDLYTLSKHYTSENVKLLVSKIT